ncbi:Phosphatidylglycerol/phosphatidylinositol transfer protein [Clydaea vesicula]|uniref:Phosphatidylglycerol/phosphatidylinositol transfer protein n=1 Tax=Clydaea vesicula TaxID=447962 RepID=A0AAD5U2W9_9FUNG|nr:Phosphatidylglycerol/phosphatidylinositol transfer protein [Clydaea vesicula]KAJ3386771.1 Phosphatidylglycerol/phosphatidylinositol transfer protein [Lobulomyces angularis]
MFVKSVVSALIIAVASSKVIYDVASPDSQFKFCGTANDALDLKKVEMNPYPPVPGQNVRVTATGTLKRVIQDGAKEAQVNVLGKKGIFKIDRIVKTCTAESELKCPIPATLPGEPDLVQSYDYLVPAIPSFIKDIELTVSAVNGDESPVTCFKGPVFF